MFTTTIKKITSLFKSVILRTKSITLNQVLYTGLITVVSISPIWILPIVGITVPMSKSLLFIISMGIIVLVSMISLFKRGTIQYYRNPLMWLLGGIIGTTIISSMVSGFAHHSFFGYSGEITSGLFIVVFCLYIYTVARYITRLEQITSIQIFILWIGSLLGILTLIALSMYKLIPLLQYLFTNSITILGSWNDLVIYFGLCSITIALLLDFTTLKKAMKALLLFFGVVILTVMGIVNAPLVWIIVAAITCLISLYTISFMYWDTTTQTYTRKPVIPVYTISIFVIAICGLVFSNGIHTLTKNIAPAYSDIRPAFARTISAGAMSLQHNPITGTGPNSFSHVWDLVKPQAISGTDYGTTPFNTGSSTLLTWIITSGVMGMLLWLGFLIMVGVIMVRLLVYPKSTVQERYVIVSVIAMCLYLFLSGLFMTVGAVILIMLAMSIGLVMVLQYRYIQPAEKMVSFTRDPRSSFFGIIGIIIIIVATTGTLITVIRSYRGVSLYQVGVRDMNNGSIDSGLVKLDQALRMSDNDVFRRDLSQVLLTQIQKLVNNDTQLSKDSLAEQIKILGGGAVTHTDQSLVYDRFNVKNWINQGDVYRFMAKLGISGTYDKALYAYHQAQKISPHDVTIDIALAQLELVMGNIHGAESLITESINKQPTSDAYIVRYQIARQNNAIDTADVALLEALKLDANNPDLYYEYGLFTYTQGNYTRAAQVLNQVITLDPSYAQAYFYLAVALEKSGNTNDADQVITWLKKNNPNTDAILNQIRTNQSMVPVAETPKKQ